MKRREFVEKAGVGVGAAALVGLATSGHARASAKAGAQPNHGPISGPLATATVSFGAGHLGSTGVRTWGLPLVSPTTFTRSSRMK